MWMDQYDRWEYSQRLWQGDQWEYSQRLLNTINNIQWEFSQRMCEWSFIIYENSLKAYADTNLQYPMRIFSKNVTTILWLVKY